MNITDILNILKDNSIYLEHNTSNISEVEIENIMLHSGIKKNKSIFFVKKGYRSDGIKFVDQANENGAILFVSDRALDIKYNFIIVKDVIKAQNILSKSIYKSPSQRIFLTGITGTNGKTTCAHIYQQFMNLLGKKCGRSGTIDVDTIKEKQISSNTFPEAPIFREYLYKSIKNGADSFVCEVSSHAIALNRSEDLSFDVKIFTNLTRDHIDFHKSMDEYFRVKKKFMLENPQSNLVINIDDSYGRKIYSESDKSKVITVGKDKRSDICLLDYKEKNGISSLTFIYEKKEYDIKYNLSGEFNCYNILCVIGALIFSGLELDEILKKIHNIKNVSGRMEHISIGCADIYIDYAHTPDALERVLQTLKEKDFVLTVFGCGGDRDPGKRKIMGQVVSENSHKVIITNDNPRTEEPENIVKDIIEGITKNNYTIILDREKAIKYALDTVCREKGALLIAGKGHETYQEIAGKKRFFSDLAVVKDYADKH